MITKQQCTLIVPPNVTGLMCGVIFAKIFAGDRVQLTYHDGETESARISKADIAASKDNFFTLVSAVQAKRPETLRG